MSQGRYRGHLPPGFSRATDDARRTEYPAEARLPHNVEDTGNYGVGGYYGGTYRQELYSSERSAPLEGYRSMDDRLRIEGGRSERNYRGKGPRSYRRSDARILEELNQLLYDDPFINASDVETAVQDGEVILSGMVEDRQAKRRIEDIAENIRGVTNVENRLRLLDSTF